MVYTMKTYKRKRQEHQEIEGVQELCRLCLGKTEDGIQIFKDGQDVCAAVAMRIMICVGLEMKHDDSLPNTICMNCYEELENCYKFRRKCEVSYQKLNSHVMALKYKEYKNVNIEVPVEYIKPKVDSILQEKTQVDAEDKAQVLDQLSEQLPEINDPVERVVEMEEVQIPIQTEASPDIGTFLSTILMELGILVKHDDGLVLQGQGINSFELETGDDEQLVLELVEEDAQDVLSQKPQIVDLNQQLQEHDGTAIKENAAGFIDAKPKQNNKKGDSKVSGPWCPECGRVFSSRSAAARHVRAHGGARPHRCPTCDRSFTQKSVLDRHMLVHLEVRPHRCARCPASFTQRGALAAHARAHVPAPRALALHRCTLCGKLFLYASGLSRHMISHSGRVFSCSSCEKQFKDRSSLLRHLRHFHNAAPSPASGS